MRKRIVIYLMLVCVMLCVGCNKASVEQKKMNKELKTTEQVEVTEQNDETQNTTASSSSEVDRVIEDSIVISDSYDDMYAVIFDNYHKALEESWDKEHLLEANISEKLIQFYGDGDGLEQVGYTLLDLNGDDLSELIVGITNQNPTMQNSILDIYTIENNQLIHVVSCQEEQTWYLCYDEAGSYQIAMIESKDVDKKGWYYWFMQESHLIVGQAIIYDKDNLTNGPWFMAYDADWNSNDDEPIEKKLAKDIIEAYENTYMQMNYEMFE